MINYKELFEAWQIAMFEMGKKYKNADPKDAMTMRGFMDDFYIQLEAIMGWDG